MGSRTAIQDAGMTIVSNARTRLRESGWIASEGMRQGGDGRPWWIVTGIKGEEMIQADGATREEAWACAAERSRSLAADGR